jgi:hypothetical protein
MNPKYIFPKGQLEINSRFSDESLTSKRFDKKRQGSYETLPFNILSA